MVEVVVSSVLSHSRMGSGVLAMSRSSPNKTGLRDFQMAVTGGLPLLWVLGLLQ